MFHAFTSTDTIQGPNAFIEFSHQGKKPLSGFPNAEFSRACPATLMAPSPCQSSSFTNGAELNTKSYHDGQIYREADSLGSGPSKNLLNGPFHPSTGGKAPRPFCVGKTGLTPSAEMHFSGKRPITSSDPLDTPSDGEIDWGFADNESDNFDPIFLNTSLSPIRHTTTTTTTEKRTTTREVTMLHSSDEEVEDSVLEEGRIFNQDEEHTVREETVTETRTSTESMTRVSPVNGFHHQTGQKTFPLRAQADYDETHKRKRSPDLVDKRSLSARKKALFARALEMLSESDEEEDDSESSILNGENSMSAYSEKQDLLDQCDNELEKIEQDKKRIDEAFAKELERINRLERTRDLVQSKFEQLEQAQNSAKLAYDETLRRMEEAKKAWIEISEKTKNKKMSVIKLDEEIDQAKAQLNSVRSERRILNERCKTTSLEMAEKLLRMSSNQPSMDSATTQRHQHTTTTTTTTMAEVSPLSYSRPTLSRGSKGPLFDTHRWPDQNDSSTSENSSSSSSDDESSSCSSDSDDPLDDKVTEEVLPKEHDGESSSDEEGSDWEVDHADENEEADGHLIDEKRLTDMEYVKHILDNGTKAQLNALGTFLPESTDKPEAFGVILNGAMCMHCGAYDKSYFDGRNGGYGYVCPTCVCGICEKPRNECKHEGFFTKAAYATNVSDYLRRGDTSLRPGTTWTNNAKGELVNETLVDKYRRMRITDKDDTAYGSGRNGMENSYKRWLRRYIIHSFSKEALYDMIYMIYELKDYVAKHSGENPYCKPLRCVICYCMFVYDNEERPRGSRSTTGNGTSHNCCTACKNLFSKSWREKYSWCMDAHKSFHSSARRRDY